jgi:hypothetical protein
MTQQEPRAYLAMTSAAYLPWHLPADDPYRGDCVMTLHNSAGHHGTVSIDRADSHVLVSDEMLFLINSGASTTRLPARHARSRTRAASVAG